MKKIVIAVLSVLVFSFILVLVITHLSSYQYNKNNSKVENSLLLSNKDIKNINVEQYYGDKLYYIVTYTLDNKEYVKILNDKRQEVLTVEKSSLKEAKKGYKLGYKYDKIIYEKKRQVKYGFIYSYYDAVTGEFIKNIKLSK